MFLTFAARDRVLTSRLSVLFFPSPYNLFVFPNSARVVLGASNYRVALVVEGAGENIVFVSLEHLKLGTGVSLPYSAGLVDTSRDDFVTLWVELNL